jgi:hypothetical protein
MDYEFSRYDDDNGRLKVEGISHSFPAVSQRYFAGDGFAVEESVDLRESGLFDPSVYLIEDNGKTYRIWKLTAKGRAVVQHSKAA